jgi:hypothetical protein
MLVFLHKLQSEESIPDILLLDSVLFVISEVNISFSFLLILSKRSFVGVVLCHWLEARDTAKAQRLLHVRKKCELTQHPSAS